MGFTVRFGNVAAAAAKSLQSCPTLSNPMDCSLPGSSVHWDSLGKNTGVGCIAFSRARLSEVVVLSADD